MNGFLFDENLPRRLTFVPSRPVTWSTALGPSPSDSALWAHAKTNQLAIVSKDTDFSDRIMLADPPPWVIHLRFGNLRRRDFHELMARVWPQVESLLPAHKPIAIYQDRIEAIRR